MKGHVVGTSNVNAIPNAQPGSAGLMSGNDKTKLNSFSNEGGPAYVLKSEVASELSTTNLNPIKTSVVTNALNDKISTSAKGVKGGVASLDATSGKIPATQLPSYVDDVIEGYMDGNASFYSDAAKKTKVTPEAGKIYVNLDNLKTYRWSGSAYVVISETISLGETESTAYRGDRGKIAYDHANAKGTALANGMYKITTNAQGHVTAGTAITKADITRLGIPSENTTYGIASTSANGLMTANMVSKLNGLDADAYVKKAGDTMTGALNMQSNAVKLGDCNVVWNATNKCVDFNFG